ncbi:NAD(P)H-hydrate dehydratase [Shigella flexneri]
MLTFCPTSGKTLGGVCRFERGGDGHCEPHDATGIIDAGNAGMASGGMGDVLSGIIGAVLWTERPLYHAAGAGCVAHGAAADRLAARYGTRGMLATDLFCTLRRVV